MKFEKLDDILNKTKKINSKIIDKPDFLKSELYKSIYRDSSDLDIFGDVPFADRFWFIYNKTSLSYCPICNKPYLYTPRTMHSFSLCTHKKSYDKKKYLKSRSLSKQSLKEELIGYVNDNKLLLSDDEFNRFIVITHNKRDNYHFPLGLNTVKFFSDIINKTKSFIPFDESDMRIAERFFCCKEKITSIPLCKYCGENKAIYINRKVGYSDNCGSEECKHLSTLDKIKDNHIKDQSKIVEIISKYINKDKYEIISYPIFKSKDNIKIKCKKCSHISEFSIKNGRISSLSEGSFYCRYCEDKTSEGEIELRQYLIDCCGISADKIVFNDRQTINPFELDIYILEKKLAIEYDGLYWHSSLNKPKNYHLSKTEMCEENDIQLVHIFENEWLHKKDIVKSRLKNLLGIYDKTIYARKCEIREVDSKQSNTFQQENHIQGSVNSSINLGLFYDNELISLMTFGKCRFNKKYEYELLRFCNKLGYHIPGSASKLLNHFEKHFNPTSLISYADRRWSRGKVYEKLGFSLSHISKPNYWYCKKNMSELHSRVMFQKHKLKYMLGVYDEKLSESKNMENNDYLKIYDCGNLVYLKTYS